MRQSEDPFNDKTAEIVHCSIKIFRNNFDWCATKNVKSVFMTLFLWLFKLYV